MIQYPMCVTEDKYVAQTTDQTIAIVARAVMCQMTVLIGFDGYLARKSDGHPRRQTRGGHRRMARGARSRLLREQLENQCGCLIGLRQDRDARLLQDLTTD
jgi:hypothetical protein